MSRKRRRRRRRRKKKKGRRPRTERQPVWRRLASDSRSMSSAVNSRAFSRPSFWRAWFRVAVSSPFTGRNGTAKPPTPCAVAVVVVVDDSQTAPITSRSISIPISPHRQSKEQQNQTKTHSSPFRAGRSRRKRPSPFLRTSSWAAANQ